MAVFGYKQIVYQDKTKKTLPLVGAFRRWKVIFTSSWWWWGAVELLEAF